MRVRAFFNVLFPKTKQYLHCSSEPRDLEFPPQPTLLAGDTIHDSADISEMQFEFLFEDFAVEMVLEELGFVKEFRWDVMGELSCEGFEGALYKFVLSRVAGADGVG